MRTLRGQRGFTLVELVVAIAIGAVLITGVAMAISQIGKFARYGGDDLRAWHDIRYAVQWMGRDLPMAETTNLVGGAGPVSILNLTWTEWSGCCTQVSHNISYSLVEGGVLERNYDGSAITVAQQVESLEFSLDSAGRVITIKVRSSPGVAVEEMTYLVYLRPAD